MSEPSLSIAFFLPTLGGGGAERNVLRLADGLLATGHRVCVIVGTGDGPNRAWVPPGATFVDLQAGRMARALLPLARHLRAHPPEVLVAALDEANVIALAARALARVDLPVVITARAIQSAHDAHARGWRAGVMLPWLVRRAYTRADAIVAVSRGAAADLARLLHLPPDRVMAIPNPVLDQRLERLRGEAVTHPWLAEIGGAPLVLAVGRLMAVKDFDLLLRAFARARTSVPNARLAILGDGEERPALEARCRTLQLGDAVLLAPFQDNPYAWMQRAGVLALSSRSEGLPTVVIEALACGARIVATDCPTGPAEILENGKWGTLVPVGDEHAFAAALVDALGQGRWPAPPLEAVRRFTAPPVVAAFERLMRPLVDRRTARWQFRTI